MITQEQAISLSTFHLPDPTNKAKCYVLRRNGRTKTWVTRPDDYSAPYKYGLYAHGVIVAPHMFGNRSDGHKGGWVDSDRVYAQADCPACKGLRS